MDPSLLLEQVSRWSLSHYQLYSYLLIPVMRQFSSRDTRLQHSWDLLSDQARAKAQRCTGSSLGRRKVGRRADAGGFIDVTQYLMVNPQQKHAFGKARGLSPTLRSTGFAMNASPTVVIHASSTPLRS